MTTNRPSLGPLPTDMIARMVPRQDGAKATVTLERFFWETLDAIAERERMTPDVLLCETDRRRALLSEAMALDVAVRLFCVSYYQQAAVLSGDPAGETIGRLMDKAMHFRP